MPIVPMGTPSPMCFLSFTHLPRSPRHCSAACRYMPPFYTCALGETGVGVVPAIATQGEEHACWEELLIATCLGTPFLPACFPGLLPFACQVGRPLEPTGSGTDRLVPISYHHLPLHLYATIPPALPFLSHTFSTYLPTFHSDPFLHSISDSNSLPPTT